ncbi:uncharacterized protein FYW49_018603 [Xenentodon cancila]
MAGTRRMQELTFFRGGATMVITVDGLNWLSKRTSWGKGIKKRDGALHLWISSGEMMTAVEERQPFMWFCILNKREDAALKSWRSPEHRSSLLRRFSSSSSSPQHCVLLKKTIQQSCFPPVLLFINVGKKDTWSKFILDMSDIFALIKNILNVVTQQDIITVAATDRHILFCDDCRPAELFSDIYSTQHWGTFFGHGSYCTADKKSVMKHSAVQIPSSPTISAEDADTESLNTRSLGNDLKFSQNYNCPNESRGRRRNVKRKKSVSFDEDVMVYLFDKESPTLELQSELETSPPGSSTYNLAGLTSENAGLEWEDDFCALENSCHIQYAVHSHTLSRPSESWAPLSRPERRSLPQTCLFLTYVTESDLEL